MKKLFITAISMLALAACNNNAQQQQDAAADSTEQVQEPLVGGDRDEHGCLPSAGQSWSELRQECVQVFEVGTRLNPVEKKEGEAVISAFVLFNDDRSKAEIFLPEGDVKSLILPKADDGTYKADRYVFNDAEQALYVDGKKAFVKE